MRKYDVRVLGSILYSIDPNTEKLDIPKTSSRDNAYSYYLPSC
jgi:hypothetical protein